MKLREWLHEKGLFVCEFAKELGYSDDYVSGVMNGTRKTTSKFINSVKLFTKGKVTASDWEGIVCDPLRKRPKGRKRKKPSQ